MRCYNYVVAFRYFITKILLNFRLTTPDWQERHLLWDEIIDWSDLFVIHVMMHLNFTEYDPEVIKKLNTTFGQVMRYIYYGSPDLL